MEAVFKKKSGQMSPKDSHTLCCKGSGADPPCYTVYFVTPWDHNLHVTYDNRQLLEMEENKSFHTCTNKGDWMLYPWLPPHAI